jgi:hypothetical protein
MDHLERQYPEQSGAGAAAGDVTVRRHLRKSCVVVQMTLQFIILSVLQFINQQLNFVQQHVRAEMRNDHHYKVQMDVLVEFTRYDEDELAVHTKSWHVSTRATPLESADLLPLFLRDKAADLDEKIARYANLSSGWVVKRIDSISSHWPLLHSHSSLRTGEKVHHQRAK